MSNVRRFLGALAIAAFIGGVFVPTRSDAQINISVNFGPPALPYYQQPAAYYQNDIWQPGYWAWSGNGYYWVPGQWVEPPQMGLLWTPGYWGWNEGAYFWHPGYWGQNVGYYGGINYGYGYFGNGFNGGSWFGNVFRYNTYVTNVNQTVIRNVYVDRTVYVNRNVNVENVSYNGGPGGVRAVPTTADRMVATEPHYEMTPAQNAAMVQARENRASFATVNNGRPAPELVARPATATPPMHESHPMIPATQPQTRVAPESSEQQRNPETEQRPVPAQAPSRSTYPTYRPAPQPPSRYTPQSMQRPTPQRTSPHYYSAPQRTARPPQSSHPSSQQHSAPRPRPSGRP